MVKIKKAKDLNGDSFYFASHAQATFLEDGSTVQDQIEQIKRVTDNYISPDLSNCVTPEQLANSLNSKQDVILDLDTIREGAIKGKEALQREDLAAVAFSNNYADLGNVPHIPTSDDVEQWGFVNQDSVAELLDSKVDAVDGKVLSSNDFTDVLKTKLENLTNYDDSEIQLAVETLRESLDTLTKSDTSAAIESFNEIIKFLETIEDSDSLSGIIAGIEQQIANKANDSSVVHLSGNETITGAKTFNGRVNFLGSGDSNAMYLSTNTRLNVDGTTNTVLGFSSGTFLINNAAYDLTLRGKGTRPTYNSTTLALSSDIPAAVTESTVSGWGFTKNTGTYVKPSTGIPKSDLASEVQTSLGKADTALQSYTEQYKGTITGVSANGTSIATSGVANIPAASTSVYGVTKLSSATNSTSTTLAATASAVKSAYDLANSKQEKLTSGTNIKTVNGESILGSGNIEIIESAISLEDTSETIDDISGTNYVKYVTQTLTDAQKTQARANIGAYSKPSGGIPKSDLASAVQTSLGKADTALQSYTEQYKGTVTGVKINGTTKSQSNGIVDLGTVITAHQTLKTINGESIVGSGNITISGGGSSSGGSGAYSEVNHGTSDTTFTLTPNTFHVWDEVASLTLDLESETSGVANEYLFQFTSGATATSLTLPDDIKWANELTIEPNMIYQVSILKGLGSVLEWNNAPTLIENKVTVSISGTKYLVSLQYAATSDTVVKVRTADGPISVNILSGETSKTASPVGPMLDSDAYIESITPLSDNNYNYIW